MRILTIFCALVLSLAFVACDEPADEAEPTEEPEEAAVAESDQEADPADDDDDHYGDDDEHEMADDLAPGESGHYGASFSDDSEPIELADAIEKLGDDNETLESVKVRAKVLHACEKRGCWMALDTDAADRPVRVHMKDYGFFVPRNGGGADVVLEGSLTSKTITEDEARHYAKHVTEQTGVDPEDVEGEQAMYEFTATAISMTMPEG